MFTIPQTVVAALEAILIILGAYFVFFWFGLIVWTFQDIRRRSNDWLVRIIAILLVLVFHVAGLIVYLIIRPQETLASVYNRQIEEEALMQSMEEKLVCPQCHRPAQADFAVCPYCGEQLKRACESCGRLLALNWTVCPYCATPVQKENAPLATELAEPVSA